MDSILEAIGNTPLDDRAGRRARRAAGHYATDQFNNPYVIPDRDWLGAEIWEQTTGRPYADL
jgi:hypothetical protein